MEPENGTVGYVLSSSGFILPYRGERDRSTPHPECVGPVRYDGDRCCELRNGPRELDSAVSEILHGIQAAKLRLA